MKTSNSTRLSSGRPGLRWNGKRASTSDAWKCLSWQRAHSDTCSVSISNNNLMLTSQHPALSLLTRPSLHLQCRS